MTERYPDCSVIVATFDRPVELARCLKSLRTQSIPRHRYEVIVVNGGSGDSSAAVCRLLARTMPLRIFNMEDQGLFHGKNIGMGAARAPIVAFMADDDIAHPDLLWQHINAHARDPRERVAVLGSVQESPKVVSTPLTRYPMDPTLSGGQTAALSLAPRRMSYKTEYLRKSEVFDETFLTELGDVELEHRLSKHGLVVRAHAAATSYTERSLDLRAAFQHAQARGRDLVRLASRHPDLEIQELCKLEQRAEQWRDVRYRLRRTLRQIRALEEEAGSEDRLAFLYTTVLHAAEGRGVSKTFGRFRRDLARPSIPADPTAHQEEMTDPAEDTSAEPTLSAHV